MVHPVHGGYGPQPELYTISQSSCDKYKYNWCLYIPFPLPSPYASCIDSCIVLCSSYLVDGGGGCSCMLLVHPIPTSADAGPDLLTLCPDLCTLQPDLGTLRLWCYPSFNWYNHSTCTGGECSQLQLALVVLFHPATIYIYIYTSIAKGGLLCYGVPSTAFRRKRSDASVLLKALLMSVMLMTESWATEVSLWCSASG